MPGRSWPTQTAADNTSAGTKPYRYGFNGKESDFEVKDIGGSSYDYGNRMYDPRLGKWLSIDPMFKKYPHMSPYTSMGNNPILFLDKKGDDIVVYGVALGTNTPAPILRIVTDQVHIDKYTQIPAPSLDVVTKKPIAPFTINLKGSDITSPDAFMVTVGFGVTCGPGTGGSLEMVLINTGKDEGVYFYKPTKPDLNLGAGVGAGASYGPIVFNKESGKELSRKTFEGNSQGFVLAAGSGVTTVKAFTDDKARLPWKDGPVLFSGVLGGTGGGTDYEARYYYSNSVIIPSMSMPVVPQASSNEENTATGD